MWKRLWKNAILALCVLALVLQPVTCFAADDLYFNNWNFLVASFQNYLIYPQTQYIPYDQNYYDESCAVGYLLSFLIGYLPDSQYWYRIRYYMSNNKYNFDVKCGPISDFTFANTTNGTGYAFANKNTHYFSQSNLIVDPVDFMDDIDNNFDPTYQTINQLEWTYMSGNSSTTHSVIVLPSTNFSLKVDYHRSQNNAINSYKYTYILDLSGNYVPTVPDSNVPTPDEPTANTDSTFLEYMVFNWIKSNFFYQQGNEFLNLSWNSVGEWITYDFLCKTNKNSPTVTVYLSDGSQTTLDNYLYGGEVDYTASLSSIQGTLNNISSKTDTTNTRLNTLNTSIDNQMNTINNKLNAAFPSNQAAINDFIAEDLMDDTGGNGLTINRIASSKSDLDDGLDTFKLDTSQSQYSNPFSALGDADWSFWSQTTLNNLGSGYSYSFSDAQLMDDTDVYTVNQNTLLNLLGW